MERLQNVKQQLSPEKEQLSKLLQVPWVYEQSKLYDFQRKGDLKNKVIVITGGSRGIGLAIAVKCAKDGAKIAILAKSEVDTPKLPAKQIEEAGGVALPIKCDVRNESEVKDALNQVIDKFGKIDILINNASAIIPTDCQNTTMKRYDMSHQASARACFMVSKYCIPYLLKAENPHILNLSPPLEQKKRWYAQVTPYLIQKLGMSMCVLGMSVEFPEININALWPRTTVGTVVIQNIGGGDSMVRTSMKPEMMADAAYLIFTSIKNTGNFFIDDEVLISNGLKDFKKYQVDPTLNYLNMTPDFYI